MIDNQITALFEKRTGGAVNIRGLQFQFYYACFRILSEFSLEDAHTITLEGIEDFDIEYQKLRLEGKEYIQLKTSQNKYDAIGFWTSGVLQNFFEAYVLDNTPKFTLVYNMPISQGKLGDQVKNGLTEDVETFWLSKLINEFPDASEHETRKFLAMGIFSNQSRTTQISRTPTKAHRVQTPSTTKIKEAERHSCSTVRPVSVVAKVGVVKEQGKESTITHEAKQAVLTDSLFCLNK